MAKIRQEINMLDQLFQAAGGSSASSDIPVLLDTAQFNGATYYFEIVADSTVSISFNVTLRRAGTSTDDATCNVPLLTTVFTLIRSSSFTPPEGTTEYVVFIDATVGATKQVKAARIIILQDASQLSTETQIEIGNLTTTTATTFVSLTQPKYWKYVAGNWSTPITVFWEVVMKCASSKSATTAELQVADGTGDGFVNWGAVGSDLTTTSTTPARVRSTAITLTDGRNYRVVLKSGTSKSAASLFLAKVIIQQGVGLTALETQYLLGNTALNSGTGLQTFLTKWDSAEWSGFKNTYTFAVDAANGSTSVVEADTAAGTQITGSVVTSPDNQGISSAMTMPADGNLDCKATTNNNDIYSSRILVFASTVFLDWHTQTHRPPMKREIVSFS